MLDKELLGILVCPKCKGDLEYQKLKKPRKDGATELLICNKCKLRYPIIDDIPHMLIEEAEKF